MDACVWKMLSTLHLSFSRAKDLERDVMHLPGKHLFFLVARPPDPGGKSVSYGWKTFQEHMWAF